MSDNSTTESSKSVEDIYLKADYKGVVDHLIKNKKDMDQGLFHYNLGTVYLKQKKYGAARYNLEKARKLGHDNELVANNIRFIQQDKNIADYSRAETVVENVISTVVDIPVYTIGSLLVGFSLIFLILLRLKKIKLSLLAFLMFFLVATPGALKVYLSYCYQDVVVIKVSKIYEGPSKIYEENGSLEAGSRILVSKKHNDWFYIVFPRYAGGWIKRENLGLY